ncbi:MAG TPA: hypothetical protein DCZ38_02640 [Coxiellaceae bacterium]|nr:MAG: hypothetical protein A2V89_03870 [Gammaproteobacteria bacterium RBG_16_37_9]HBC71665.1 hypothetical protein [Coxiellaceae bacterium]
MKIKLKICAAAFALISALLLSGCHTIEGFGQDMERGGQNLQKAATGTDTNDASAQKTSK